MANRFKDKTVVITGGNSGIGHASAIKFAGEGANVAIIGRNPTSGSAVVSEIAKAGGSARFYQADIGQSSDIEDAFREILAEYQQIDIAFNNAGYSGGVHEFDDVSFAEFDEVIQTNLYGVYHCMKHQLRHFLEHQIPGVIVNCSSVSGIVGAPYQSAYSASKHAVVGLTKSVALEYASKGIRINAVCPGGVKTPMLKDYFSKLDKDKLQKLQPAAIGRTGDPKEVANAVLWLCSNEASFVIGQAYAIDGGYTVS